MTLQASESIKIGEEEYWMDNYPLTDYLKDKGYKFVIKHSACWRGYVGKWELKNNELYLIGFNSQIISRSPDGSIVPKILDLRFLFPDASEVKATWFTGFLEIPIGKVIGYHRDDDRYPVYSDVMEVEIEQGNVVKTTNKHYTQEDIEQKEECYLTDAIFDGNEEYDPNKQCFNHKCFNFENCKHGFNFEHRAKERLGTQAWLLLSEGNHKLETGNYKDAIALYKKIIDITTETIKNNPQDEIAFRYRGDAKMKIPYNEAIEDFTKAIEIDPLNIKAYSGRAIAKELSQDLLGAIEDYTRIIEIDANNAEAYVKRGLIHQERYIQEIDKNGISKAIEDFSKAHETNTKYLEFIRHIGKAKYIKGLYHEAIEEYTKAIEIFEIDKIRKESFDWEMRASIKEEINDLDGAIEDYLKAIEINNKDSSSYCSLAEIYFDKKEYEQALKYANKAVDLCPTKNINKLKNRIIDVLNLKNNKV